MINQVVLVGRITANPELKQSPNGTYYCQFTLAVNRPRTQNNPNPGTDFVPVVVFNGQAQSLAKFIQKGRQLAVTGSLRVDRITLQDGTQRTSIRVFADRVEFLGSPANGQQQAAQQAVPQAQPVQQVQQPVQRPAQPVQQQPVQVQQPVQQPAQQPVQQPAQPAQQPVQVAGEPVPAVEDFGVPVDSVEIFDDVPF